MAGTDLIFQLLPSTGDLTAAGISLRSGQRHASAVATSSKQFPVRCAQILVADACVVQICWQETRFRSLAAATPQSKGHKQVTNLPLLLFEHSQLLLQSTKAIQKLKKNVDK